MAQHEARLQESMRRHVNKHFVFTLLHRQPTYWTCAAGSNPLAFITAAASADWRYLTSALAASAFLAAVGIAIAHVVMLCSSPGSEPNSSNLGTEISSPDYCIA